MGQHSSHSRIAEGVQEVYESSLVRKSPRWYPFKRPKITEHDPSRTVETRRSDYSCSVHIG